MSIQILKNGADVTNQTNKLTKVYTNGYVAPTGDIVENYSIVYSPEDGETNITVTFPPTRTETESFEILFETPNGESLNSQTIQLEDFNNNSYNFTVRIAKSVVDTLDGVIAENIFNRQIWINKKSSSTSYTLGYRFALDKNELSFETLDISKVTVAAQLFLDQEDGNTQLVPVSNIAEADRGQLYKVEYKPSYANQVQRTQPTLRGFSDTTRPNSFIIEFTRTSTAGDVDDNYDIIFNKSGYKDGFGNELLGTKQLLNIISGPIVVEKTEYITRMTQDGREIFNVSLDAPEGIIDISGISVSLYELMSGTQTIGAQVRPEDIKEYYIVVGGSGVDLGGITINGQVASPESLTGTKRFGPFSPELPVEIIGTMQNGSNVASLKLTHYAYLNETNVDGTPIASQMDTQQTIFNISRSSIGEPPPPIFWPPTSLFTINTGIEPELIDVSRITSTGTATSVPEEQWTFDQLFDQYSQLQPVVLTYQFTIDPPTSQPLQDGKLQYRQYNPYTNTRTDWYDVSSSPFDIAREGIAYNHNNPLILPAEFMASGQRKIQVGLVPFEWTTLRNVYEFRTVGLEDPESIRSLDYADSYMMMVSTPDNPDGSLI